MKKITQRLNASARRAAFVITGTVASSAAFADTATDITDAFTAGETNYQLAVGGLIGLAAIGVAVGFIISMLRRS
ncbi:hypothetical protein [Thalassolituus sp. ST750PaO-4]|uniref:hypothetical protein n=1 Tax=Thalassolituus sp. ST750PaO-4 TaxID=2742965 RepID=UPI001CE2F897|nr:hypothetical protein [Thalassolituus sp. ST750PaO-4]